MRLPGGQAQGRAPTPNYCEDTKLTLKERPFLSIRAFVAGGYDRDHNQRAISTEIRDFASSKTKKPVPYTGYRLSLVGNDCSVLFEVLEGPVVVHHVDTCGRCPQHHAALVLLRSTVSCLGRVLRPP